MKWFVPRPILLTAALTVVAIVGSAWSPAGAQSPVKSVDLTIPAPAPPVPEFGLQPAMPPEQRGSREQEFYPGPDSVKSRHEPAFVTPFVTTVRGSRDSGARVGLSGWTAPAVPFDIPQATGGAAFGLTVIWGVPLAEGKAPEPESSGQR
jgi:hypothetical protein